MTPDQQKAIEEFIAAGESCRKRAEHCNRLGLTVLAVEYDYYSKSIAERVEWQLRTLRKLDAANSDMEKPNAKT